MEVGGVKGVVEMGSLGGGGVGYPGAILLPNLWLLHLLILLIVYSVFSQN